MIRLEVRFPLSLRNIENLLFEHGIEISLETVRRRWDKFGMMFAGDIRRRVSRMRAYRKWRLHSDEMYGRPDGEMVYFWRAIDRQGEVLELPHRAHVRKAALGSRRKR